MELFVPGSGSWGLGSSVERAVANERVSDGWAKSCSEWAGGRGRVGRAGEREQGSPVRKQLSRESRHLAARRLPGVSYIDLIWLISRFNFAARSMITAANQDLYLAFFSHITFIFYIHSYVLPFYTLIKDS